MEEENNPEKQTSDNPRTPQQPSRYKKHPIWQWVVLYVILAAIVYTIIYMLFMGNY